MTDHPTAPTTLGELLELADTQARQIAEQEARRAVEREHQNLRQDRAAAVAETTKRLKMETVPAAWERVPAAEDHVSRSLMLRFPDEPDLALAFRNRGITEGGPILTVLALADTDELDDVPDEGVWVGSILEVARLADLPRVVEDARRSADEWVEDQALEVGDPDYVDAEGGQTDPRFRIEAQTIGELLEVAIAIAVQRYALPD